MQVPLTRSHAFGLLVTVTDEAILEAQGVHKRFGRSKILRGASLSARPGEIAAILGENGSGKSTLLKILAGRERMDHGRLIRRGPVGYCPQEAVLYPHLTPDEHVDLFGLAYGLPPAFALSLYETATAIVRPYLEPLHLDRVALGFFLGGLTYGILGLCLGAAAAHELEGIFAIVLFTNIDVGWLQNPIYYASSAQRGLIDGLPGHHPTQIAITTSPSSPMQSKYHFESSKFGAEAVELTSPRPSVVWRAQRPVRSVLARRSGPF